jgi:tricorn protease
MSAQSQTQKPIFRYPDVSEKEIVFGYANDLWIVSKNGGLARKLSSPPGPENWARFSPDGNEIAYAANYGGFSNIFTITPFGGLPRQLTYHDMGQRVVDWYPDGKHLLISSSMQSGKQRFSQFFKISKGRRIAGEIAHCPCRVWQSVSGRQAHSLHR